MMKTSICMIGSHKIYFPAVKLRCIALVCIFLFAGCVRALDLHHTTIDTLPPDAPKGYVEFYSFLSVNTVYDTGYAPSILEAVSGGEQFLAHVIKASDTGRNCTIAKKIIAASPGVHTYIFKLGTFNRRVTVSIAENFVTPVQIKYTNIYVPDEGLCEVFDADLISESPQRVLINGKSMADRCAEQEVQEREKSKK